jgi:hypothetical protein
VVTTIHATYDNGQGTTDKSIDQYDHDADIYMNAAIDYENEQSTADRRNRQLQVHSTQGNEGVAYPADEDQRHAMEEDNDQDQGEDHCTSMVYSNGQTTNTLNWKQRKNIKNHNKSVTKAKNKKIKKKEKRKNERSQTHNCMHPEEEEMV